MLKSVGVERRDRQSLTQCQAGAEEHSFLFEKIKLFAVLGVSLKWCGIILSRWNQMSVRLIFSQSFPRQSILREKKGKQRFSQA